MADYLLGIDFGTGGAKACITDSELNVCAYAYRSYQILVKRPGWSEHCVSDYWDAACQIIKECLYKSAIDCKDIRMIAISCAMPSTILVDEDGVPLCNAYNLMDRRATAQIKQLLEQYGERYFFDITANRLEDQPSLISILWEKENRPELYKKIRKVYTVSSYIKYKLSGVSNISYSDGPLYGLAYDIRKNEFRRSVLDQLDIPAEILPEVSGCEEIVGVVSEKAALETGLAAGTPLAAGQADCNAGWLGGGAVEPGDIQMNLGTCGNFGVIHQSTDFMDSMINIAYTAGAENTYVVIPTTTTGGQMLRYMKENFSDLELAAEKATGIDCYDMLNLEAEAVSAGADGLLVLPYLMGERTPLWNANARGVVFGMSLNHTKAHLVRAMMEGVAYALYQSFELVSAHYPRINYPIVLNEGGAKSRLWRRIITDVFDQPTVTLKNRFGAPYGDCILAAKAAGLIPDYRIAREKAEYIEPMEPDGRTHEMYMEYFDLFKRIYRHVEDDFEALTSIRGKYLLK